MDEKLNVSEMESLLIERIKEFENDPGGVIDLREALDNLKEKYGF